MFVDVRTNVCEKIVTVLSMKISNVYLTSVVKLVFKPKKNYSSQS